MTMQRIELDVSSDIIDKVLFFLENLPKNKVKLNFENHSKIPQKRISPFEDFLSHTQEVDTIKKFDRDSLHER